MTSNRIFSLNDIATDFVVEELEPRFEMQMFGLGADPGVFAIPLRSGLGILIVSICTYFGYCY